MSKSIRLYGMVQQVGFRYFVYRLAGELGVQGFVKNMPDGSVLIEAECEDHVMVVFVEHCKTGSPQSKVIRCDVNQIEIKDYKDFKIW